MAAQRGQRTHSKWVVKPRPDCLIVLTCGIGPCHLTRRTEKRAFNRRPLGSYHGTRQVWGAIGLPVPMYTLLDVPGWLKVCP